MAERTQTNSVQSRAVRFLGVTVITALLGQTLIFFFFAILEWDALVANGVAVLIVGIVGFVLSLMFVWRDSDESKRSLQMSVFLAMSLLGLLVSSLTVSFATRRIDHDLAANVGSFAGYGVAWLLRFAVLERFVFRDV